MTLLEKMLRRLVSSISAIDILFARLRKHESTPLESLDSDELATVRAVHDKLTASLTTAISHSASLAVRSVASLFQQRRKAMIDNATLLDIPDPTRVNKPPSQTWSTSGLFIERLPFAMILPSLRRSRTATPRPGMRLMRMASFSSSQYLPSNAA